MLLLRRGKKGHCKEGHANAPENTSCKANDRAHLVIEAIHFHAVNPFADDAKNGPHHERRDGVDQQHGYELIRWRIHKRDVRSHAVRKPNCHEVAHHERRDVRHLPGHSFEVAVQRERSKDR